MLRSLRSLATVAALLTPLVGGLFACAASSGPVYAPVLIQFGDLTDEEDSSGVQFIADVNGTIWVASGNALYSIDPTTIGLTLRFPGKKTDLEDKDSLEISSVEGAWGDTWLGTNQGLFRVFGRLEGDSLFLLETDNQNISALQYHGYTNSLYVGTSDGLRQITREQPTKIALHQNVVSIFITEDGRLLVGTDQDLYVLARIDDPENISDTSFVPLVHGVRLANARIVIESQGSMFVLIREAGSGFFAANDESIVEIRDGRAVGKVIERGAVAGLNEVQKTEFWYSIVGQRFENRKHALLRRTESRIDEPVRGLELVPLDALFNAMLATEDGIWLGTTAGLYHRGLTGGGQFKQLDLDRNSDIEVLGLVSIDNTIWAWDTRGEVFRILEDVDVKLKFDNAVPFCGVQALSGKRLTIRDAVYTDSGGRIMVIAGMSSNVDEEFWGILETSEEDYGKWKGQVDKYPVLRHLSDGKAVPAGPSIVHASIKDSQGNIRHFPEIWVFAIAWPEKSIIIISIVVLVWIVDPACFVTGALLRADRLVPLASEAFILQSDRFRKFLRWQYSRRMKFTEGVTDFSESELHLLLSDLSREGSWSVVVDEKRIDGFLNRIVSEMAKWRTLTTALPILVNISELSGKSRSSDGIRRLIQRRLVRGIRCINDTLADRIIDNGDIVLLFRMRSLDDKASEYLRELISIEQFRILTVAVEPGASMDEATDLRSVDRDPDPDVDTRPESPSP